MSALKTKLEAEAEGMQKRLGVGWTAVVALESDNSHDAVAHIVTGDPEDQEASLALAAALNTLVGMLRVYGGAK